MESGSRNSPLGPLRAPPPKARWSCNNFPRSTPRACPRSLAQGGGAESGLKAFRILRKDSLRSVWNQRFFSGILRKDFIFVQYIRSCEVYRGVFECFGGVLQRFWKFRRMLGFWMVLEFQVKMYSGKQG